jgi:hypothetical protein
MFLERMAAKSGEYRLRSRESFTFFGKYFERLRSRDSSTFFGKYGCEVERALPVKSRER